MWDKLVFLMTEIVAMYRLILKLSQDKKKVLVSARVDELNELTKQEEGLILQIGKLESAREQVVAELAGLYGLLAKDLTLAKAKELAGGEVSAKLQAIEEELSQITAELVPINQINTELIQQSLNYVNYNLNILTQGSTSTNYAAKGQGESPRPKAVIDAKV